MKKIKILYGLEATGGGALKHLVYLVTRLNKEIFDITVILSNSRKENVTDKINSMKVAGAKVIYVPMRRNISPIKDFIAIIKLILFLKNEDFYILHAHCSKAGGLFRLAAWYCKIPYVLYTPHSFHFQGKHGLKKYYFVLLERLLSKITAGIIVSENEQNEIIKNRIAPDSKIININNAIDFDEYHQDREVTLTKLKLGIDKNAFVVGAIGRLAPQKDWKTYIYAANEVLKRHRNTTFLIVGSGDLYIDIQRLIQKLQLSDKILLTGQVEDISKIFGIIDIYVNTSLWEGLPYVLLEAMNYKKPIITTNTGNGTLIVHNESGFTSPTKDYRFIAEKISLLIENRRLSIQMGENGAELLTKKYSFQLFIQKHQELYKSFLNS